MPNRQIHLSIQEGLPSPTPEACLHNAALAALDAGFPNQDCQLTLALCDDDTILNLNSRYRGENKITDVLAFSSTHDGPWQGDDDPHPSQPEPHSAFPTPPNDPPYLGDVIVCLPQAHRQAAKARHSPQKETALLIIHGILHLLGHDHYHEHEKAMMWSLQDQAMTTLFGPTAPIPP